MKRTLLLFLLLSSLTSFAQKKDKRKGFYSAYLSSVEVSKNVTLGTVDTLLSTYEDSLIKVDWDYAVSQIGFELTNKSEQTLKIIWDDAAFISMTNETGKVFHKGIKYIDRENSQPATSIYKGTTLSDLVAPTSYVSYSSGQYGGWNSRPLIPIKGSIWSKKVDYEEYLIGQTMRVVLPIKKDDQTIEYTFIFKTEFIEKEKK
jgi:hypothetical protein